MWIVTALLERTSLENSHHLKTLHISQERAAALSLEYKYLCGRIWLHLAIWWPMKYLRLQTSSLPPHLLIDTAVIECIINSRADFLPLVFLFVLILWHWNFITIGTSQCVCGNIQVAFVILVNIECSGSFWCTNRSKKDKDNYNYAFHLKLNTSLCLANNSSINYLKTEDHGRFLKKNEKKWTAQCPCPSPDADMAPY